MKPDKIMIIRHAEKPDEGGGFAGLTDDGQPDAEGLTVRGWQRAGALARFFHPVAAGFAHAALAEPTTIFASDGKSQRPRQTVLPLSQLMGIAVNLDHAKGEEIELANAVSSTGGVVLICWQHELVPAIVNAITGNTTTCPQHWKGDRFDLVWVLDPVAEGWQLTQVPQMLLAGDRPNPITH